MKIKPMTLGNVQKAHQKLKQKQIADASKRRFDNMVKQKAQDILPPRIVDVRLCNSKSDKNVTELIQSYMGKLGNSDWAPWSRVK